jgi:hypothetical protein
MGIAAWGVFRRQLAVLSAGCFAALTLTPCSAGSQAQPDAPMTRIAELGIALPAVGGLRWTAIGKRYFNPAVMHDIRYNLHASYVRTGWIPGWFHSEQIPWNRENQGLDAICASGLHVMVIVPSPRDDKRGEADLIANIGDFFAHYSRREFGCLRYAEVANEADLAANGFKNVSDYASFYERVAPMIAVFGIDVITSGTSGEDVPWTIALASILRGVDPSPPLSGYGFHPYGVPPADMAGAVQQMRDAAAAGEDGPAPTVYVTEIAQKNPTDLYQTIVNLAPVTPAITIYEYMAQHNEDPEYGLRDNPALYTAVQRAWDFINAGR